MKESEPCYGLTPFSWDGENRLVGLTNRASAAPAQLLRFEYDAKSRRIHKQVWSNSDGSGTAATDLRFGYDDWNLIAEFNAGGSAVRTYARGLDLSGSLRDAGGIGGLLAVEDTANGTNFAAFDGNGNVAALSAAAGGTASALYEYGPFGELLRATGPVAKANPFRFSTKYQDDETDLVYYGYRYYNASAGRWLNRDPLAEPGFELMANRPKNRTITPEKVHLMKALAELRAINPTLAVRITDEFPQLRESSDAEGDPIASDPYIFVQNGPVAKIDVLGLDVIGHFYVCAFLCNCRVKFGVVTAITPFPVPSNAETRCCKGTRNLFCDALATALPGSFNWLVEQEAASVYYNTCMWANQRR